MAKIDYLNTGKKLGLALKRARKEKGFSQMSLAEKTQLKQKTISAIESGKGTLESLFKIIQVLQVNLSVETGSMTKRSHAQEILDLLGEE